MREINEHLVLNNVYRDMIAKLRSQESKSILKARFDTGIKNKIRNEMTLVTTSSLETMSMIIYVTEGGMQRHP